MAPLQYWQQPINFSTQADAVLKIQYLNKYKHLSNISSCDFVSFFIY